MKENVNPVKRSYRLLQINAIFTALGFALYKTTPFHYTIPMLSRSRRLLAVCLCLCSLSAHAQILSGVRETGAALTVEGEAAVPELFPLLMLVRSAVSTDTFWRPDWPLDIPPDAFSAPASGITLTTETGEYTLRYNKQGLAVEFPFLLSGGMAQVQTIIGSQGEIQGFIVIPAAGADNALGVEFIGYENDLPVRARCTSGGTVYFTALHYGGTQSSEIWYDSEGNALGAFLYRFSAADGPAAWELPSLSLRSLEFRSLAAAALEGSAPDVHAGDNLTRYAYDSWGNISEIGSSGGICSALYSAPAQVRYWTRPFLSAYTLQWDAGGLLIRMIPRTPTGSDGTYASTDTADADEYRYEYTLDERGNWIERREIRLMRRSGLLVPAGEHWVRRKMLYETNETDGGA